MSARFDVLTSPIAGLYVLQRKPIADSRGYFERLFCAGELEDLLQGRRIEQINHSVTSFRGAVRGLHFQYPPHAETKIVMCLKGEVFDVAVDLRRGSPHFLRWHAEVLSGENHRAFFIPEGFAHGFQVLSDGCELLYLHTAPYRPDAEGGVDALDPALNIRWSLPVTERSARDMRLPRLGQDFEGMIP